MKKAIILLICLFPFLIADAENEFKCLESSKDDLIVLESVNNFQCINVKDSNLIFKNNEKDLSQYFNYSINDSTATINIKDNSLSFNSDLEYGIVVVYNGDESFPLYIKNTAYVKPTQTTTTTTQNVNQITYTIILDNKGEKEEKKCNAKQKGDYCYITLPNLETEGFTGWGTSNTCKNGNIGSTKVNENKTYYACYELQDIKTDIYLKSLKILNNNNEEVDFGIFSIKKQEYNFKVLNNVNKLNIEALSEDNITIEIFGNDNLIVGENDIIIKLTDENNNTNEYKLKVTRLKEGETITNINYLSALVIGNYSINFNKSVFNYDVVIDNDIYKLEINAVPLDENKRVDIKNNNNLENGSVISIDVSDGEGNITTYKINIIKESNNILIYIAIGTILLLIIILIILIIIKKNQKKKLVKKTDNKNDINVEVLTI